LFEEQLAVVQKSFFTSQAQKSLACKTFPLTVPLHYRQQIFFPYHGIRRSYMYNHVYMIKNIRVYPPTWRVSEPHLSTGAFTPIGRLVSKKKNKEARTVCGQKMASKKMESGEAIMCSHFH
jgi:hypothetical protein